MERQNITSKLNIDISEAMRNNTDTLYSILFYVSGLMLGTLLFNNLQLNNYSGIVENIMINTSGSWLEIFLRGLSVYLSIYALVIIISLCIIGFPIINVLPLMCGFVVALKLSYYYNLYNGKGIVYALLMIIPEFCLFMTVLIDTINYAKQLSKNIYETSRGNKNNSEYELSTYFKCFMKNTIIIIVINSINSLLLYMFNAVVNI